MKESLKKILNEMRGSTALKNLTDPARNARFEAGVATVADQKIYDKAFVKKDMTDAGQTASRLLAQAKNTKNPKEAENLSVKASQFIKSGLESKGQLPKNPESKDFKTRLSSTNEMSVSGIAPVDGTSQGPLIKHNNKFSFGEWSKLRKSKKVKK
jgi:hypothetical protein